MIWSGDDFFEGFYIENYSKKDAYTNFSSSNTHMSLSISSHMWLEYMEENGGGGSGIIPVYVSSILPAVPHIETNYPTNDINVRISTDLLHR